jgi:small-conductance mechanosensitive channel
MTKITSKDGSCRAALQTQADQAHPRRRYARKVSVTAARIAGVAAVLLAVLCAGVGQASSGNPGDQLLDLLKQSIEWYRNVQVPAQVSSDPADSIYSSYNRGTSLQTLALIFEFSRVRAQQIETEHPSTPTSGSGGSQTTYTLAQMIATAQSSVQQESATLQTMQQQLARAGGKKRQTIENQIAEEKSTLELAKEQVEVLQQLNVFALAGASEGLPGKIDELERTVPEVRMMAHGTHSPAKPEVEESGSEPANDGAAGNAAANAQHAEMPPAAAPGTPQAPEAKQPAESGGIIALSEQLISLTSKLKAQTGAINSTATLRAALGRIRQPLADRVRKVAQAGDQLAAQPQSNDPAVLGNRSKQTEALTAQYKELSAALIPLAKASILLDGASNNMIEWRSETQRTYTRLGRALLLRVAVLAIVLVVIAVASDFWRRAIFRYIHEQRRRNHFMMLRRFAVGMAVALVLVFGFVTEFGSLATFAGFLTAGLALALQNVILSVAAYFFLIGRYGIRTGDRVQIGGVTGDVVEIGMVQIHLVEIDTSGGDSRPTGRIVGISNSVFFQPTSSFFKQLPDSNFAWRSITLTLAPDVDYTLAQKRISEAVAGVCDAYKNDLEQQHQLLESSLAIQIASPEPRTRLRLKDAGLEIIILYPVVLSQAAQIDDKMTRALLEAIEADSRLRLVGGGLAAIKPVDATPSHSDKSPSS